MEKRITIGQRICAFPHPHQWIEPADLLNMRFAVFEGLVKYDAGLNIRPGLAENWTVSDDARKWVFTIRENVRFHDGTFLTAADAAASIRNASAPDAEGALGTGGLLHRYLGQAAFSVPDSRHLELTLPEPMADLPDLLVYVMIIPEHSTDLTPEQIPGTGPFRFLSRDGQNWVFCRFDGYWGMPSETEELVFHAEPDQERRIALLLKGEADLITGIDGKFTSRIEVNDDFCVIEHDSMTAVVLMMNCENGPFADVRVRQAVNFGTNKEELIQTSCDGWAVPLNGPLTARHFAASTDVRPYPYDTRKAWKLLSDAGYSEGLELTLYRPERLPDNAAALSKCLKQQWARFGIKLHEAVQPDREQYALDVREGKIHDLCLFDSSPVSTWRVFHEKLQSGVEGSWGQGYASAEFDALVLRAARTPDMKKRRAFYQQALRVVTDDAPWVFLYSPVDFSAASWDLLERSPLIGQRADGLILFD